MMTCYLLLIRVMTCLFYPWIHGSGGSKVITDHRNTQKEDTEILHRLAHDTEISRRDTELSDRARWKDGRKDAAEDGPTCQMKRN